MPAQLVPDLFLNRHIDLRDLGAVLLEMAPPVTTDETLRRHLPGATDQANGKLQKLPINGRSIERVVHLSSLSRPLRP
ncbi:hypothetical protein SCOCK_450038 [Actinacidiphila cocklensis]|uniref:Uncharacterized protein n=1 Tax=Actinacidiphila cocklensis TaxID=887465 RepID=A0A9W4DV30_9ACTN|nr:hypothetical protein SCOCK_450038 [Actinacidiphila cocklensis]